jgi:DNA polymerase-3 subunit gamma/tau
VLSGAVEKGGVSHAYLFSGRRGIGKTSIARILAKKLGTAERDIYEIDAASHRGIDDVRELKEAVTSLPYESDYKVYIIDEVHMLTKPAFNALLKTLEEPPEYVIFILATTEPDELPETVTSRCETHEFRQPSADQLSDAIMDVAEKEKRDIDPAGAAIIARAADGSFRDAFGLLEKCIRAADGESVSADLAETVTGVPPHELVSEIVFSGIAKGNPDTALKAINQVEAKNLDPDKLFSRVIAVVRSVLQIRLAPDLAEGIEKEISNELYEKITEAADAGSASGITPRTLHTLLRYRNKLAADTLGHLPLEVAVLSLTEK